MSLWSKVKKASKSLTKSVSKTVSGAVKTASNVSGSVASKAIDAATLGQRKTLNSVSGGALDSLEGVYRGNSSDILRLGITGAAAVGGGPMAGVAANQAFAQGASPLQVLASTGGTGMEWLDSATNFLNNPMAQQLLGLNKPAPAPKPAAVTAAPPTVVSSVKPGGMSTSTMLMVGGAVLAVVVAGFFLMRGKRG